MGGFVLFGLKLSGRQFTGTFLKGYYNRLSWWAILFDIIYSMSISHRPWALWRRVQYGLILLSFVVLFGVYIYYANFTQVETCFDLEMNGDETGIDCGGGCVRFCSADILPPRVVWAKSFEVIKDQYNAVAYVENLSQTAAAPDLEYTFELISRGNVVATRSGTTVLPPNTTSPIFEGKILVDSNEPVTETRITLNPSNLWIPASINRNQFRSIDIDLTGADTQPRLGVEVENTGITAAENIEVIATIFNDSDTPVAASRTYIEYIEARSTRNIVFTWPNSIAKTVKNCIIPTDVAVGIDLSGSMNNDGSTPPQPITASLQAAGQFIESLGAKDQVAVVTFASHSKVITELNSLHKVVADTVLTLEIDLEEETGFTNTVEALLVAQAELNSEKHNPDARRVLVLLTDGLPTSNDGKDVITLAEETAQSLSDDGIEVYAIGLGQGVDRGFISNIASDETNAYFAPTGSDLKKIYSEITSSLCESGATKIDVIVKPETNFAPLR
ncbi:MAG: Mg-chelatase subunit ChlD [Candidatus Paceibacteria bacterium]|jgi:Mg-chelatase subunit ChlD